MVKFALFKDDTAPAVELFVKYDSEEVVPDKHFIELHTTKIINQTLGCDHNFHMVEYDLNKRD